jgi:hypothetical protein
MTTGSQTRQSRLSAVLCLLTLQTQKSYLLSSKKNFGGLILRLSIQVKPGYDDERKTIFTPNEDLVIVQASQFARCRLANHNFQLVHRLRRDAETPIRGGCGGTALPVRGDIG